jgi:hypothetical protein
MGTMPEALPVEGALGRRVSYNAKAYIIRRESYVFLDGVGSF